MGVSILDPLRPYAEAIKWGAILLLALLLFALGWNRGADRWQGKYDGEVKAHAATRAQHKAALDALAAKARAAADKAKASAKAAKDAREANDKRYAGAEREAERAKRDLERGLRNGTVRLRDEWACPVPRPAKGGTATAAGRQDASADLRAAGAANLVAAGDAADRWIVWLQSELTSTREACK